METNNSRLDQKSTDNKEEKDEWRGAKIGIFSFIIVLLLYLFFIDIGTSPLLFLSLPIIIGFGISKVFFGIGFGDFLIHLLKVLEGLAHIVIILGILLGILLILLAILF